MGLNLRIALFIFSIIWLLIIFVCIRKKKLPIKYSIVWICAIAVIMLISIFPTILDVFATLFGFTTISNLIIGVILTLLLMITLVLTIIVSRQKEQIIKLVQEISLLKGNKK